MTRTLVFLLEEISARDLLEGLVPRLIPSDILVRYLVFEGKQDLEKQLTRKLQGWLVPDSLFVVLRDQDAGDCTNVKVGLVDRVRASGQARVLVRVACRELESWLLGDWTAVARAFDEPRLADLARKAAYRDPDQLHSPVTELRKVIPHYQKRDGARRTGALLDRAHNQSSSFRVFCDGLQALLAVP